MPLPLGTLLAALAIGAGPQNAAIDHFEKKIRPVLASHCYACHSKSAAAPQGGLLLDSTQGIRRGGNSGAAIQPGDPDNSLLIRAIRHTDKKLKMPPGDPLSPEVVADFELWIREGASLPADPVDDRQEAAFTVVFAETTVAGASRPSRDQSWVRNDIDRFVLEPPGSQESRAVPRGRQANADPPGDLRLDRAAADG